MILVDPDLAPSLAPASLSSAKLSPASKSLSSARNLRLPSTRALARFLALAQTTVRLKGQVTVLLTTDAAIRKLNRQFRGKDKATDVLSFPAGGFGAEDIAGDLAVSVPTALKQALGQKHSLSTEVKVLILHGLLHLADYDHETDSGQMARRERLLRNRLGLPQGLIERAATPEPSVLPKKRVPISSKKLGAPSLRRTSVARVGSQEARATKPPSASCKPSSRKPSGRGRQP